MFHYTARKLCLNALLVPTFCILRANVIGLNSLHSPYVCDLPQLEGNAHLIAIQLGQQEIYPFNLYHRFAGLQNRTAHTQTLLRNYAKETRK